MVVMLMPDNKEYMREYQRTHKVEKARNSKKYRSTLIGCLRERFNRIKERCNDPRHPRYKDYGGRGIRCLFNTSDEFIDYVTNELKIDPRGLQVDRIENNGNYEPGNIRFVTPKVNCSNRRAVNR